MSAKAPRKKIRWDLWMIVTVGVSIFYMLFLLYPLISMLSKSVIGEDGGFTWQYFAKVFHKKYYQRAIWGSLKISATVTLITVLLATPLAYIMSTVKIRFAGALQILILVSSMSAPFIGAYAWIMLCGRNGTITNFLLNTFGFRLGDIYGFKGCVIVMSLQLYSLVFMFVSGAFKNLDNSLIEASESLGCSGVRKVFKIVLPLILPTLLSGALMVFMRTFADYGTPMLIGENYNTLPVVVYKEFLSEIGSSDGMAAAISIIAIVITTAVFLLQKYIANRKVFSMSALHPVEAKKLHGVKNVLAHAYCYILVGRAIMPQCYVIYSSFRNTSGKLYTDGFGLGSYKEAFSTVGSSIVHTYALAFAAIFVIVLVSLFVSDAESVAFGAAFLRLRILALPAIVLEFALNSAFQATGRSKQSLIVSVLRKGTFDLPLMVALNATWPVYGLMLVQPIMESITALTAVTLWVRLGHHNAKKRRESAAQLPANA